MRSIAVPGFFAAPIIGIVMTAWVAMSSHAVAFRQEEGKKAFERHCAGCHGNEGAGGSGPALVPLTRDISALFAVVRQGGAQMTPFSTNEITDAEVTAVADYLRSLRAVATAPGTSTPSSTTSRSTKSTPATFAN